MKKLDNFSNCLNVLKNADFAFAESNDIYRTGIGKIQLPVSCNHKINTIK